MMMVLCFLMSIPLKMMAYDEVKVMSQYKVDKWSENTNFKFTTTDGKIYTCTLNDVPAGTQYIWFRLKIGETEYGPQQDATKDLTLTSSYQKIYQISWEEPKALMIDNTSGKTSYTITYDRVNNNIKCDASEGGSTGGGPEGGTTVNWNTVSENRLTAKPRVYSQGFYLAGNFFTFDKKDEINYDDAVFKFQQQKDQDISIAEGARTVYDIYKVEIPASLTAYAQVMYVDELGNKKYIFGPGSAYDINKDKPKTDESIGWLKATANDREEPITLENANYWNFVSRNESYNEYSDGMYNLFIAVNPKTHIVANWKIEHDSDKRVAYFISDAPDATAMPVYDAFDDSHGYNFFSNKFYASVNFSADYNYYVISNILVKPQYTQWTENDYGTKTNGKNYLPTTNKLFLQGNGGYELSTNDQHNQVSPNEKPMPGGDLGNIIVEYNPSQGYDGPANTAEHFGIRGQISPKGGRTKITSVSMVGDAIPGTLKEDGSWDYTSKAADMTYVEVDQCYMTTVETTVADCGKHFRFVGNHDPKINWFENTGGIDPDPNEMAKNPYDSKDPKVLGHTAEANDPNKVNYTQDGANPGEDWNIIWNRPAGRWTVRLYFYTRNVNGEPVTDYYYTITANHDLVLRDFDKVQYKGEGERKIFLRGGYKFFRTWSDHKAWKVSKDVDIFIVNDMRKGTNSVEFSLEKISGSNTANVIPADVGVILATKKDATDIEGGGRFYDRPSLTSYNTLVIPMEEYTGEETTADYSDNCLVPMVEAGVVPTYNKDKDEYNYLFGFFRANKGLNVTTFKNNEFLLGFWLSKGSGLFYSNSAYLPVKSAKAANMKLGTQYGKFETNPTTGKSVNIPALLFDFANVGGTTGINEVVNQSTKLNDGKYYTLSGQQVEKPTAGGIYIHNGRKFVVK